MSAVSTIRGGPTGSPRRGISINETVDVPFWVVDFDSFRRWARSEEFPRRGQFAYLGDHLWVSDIGFRLLTTTDEFGRPEYSLEVLESK
jgi:hypothetical protein